MNRDILRITIPSIVSNITVPLLGLVDTAIVGHLGSAAFIGAIALGGMMFSLAYWVFSFLRMGTAGITAQAVGAGAEAEAQQALRRALRWALLISVVLIVCQPLITTGALALVHAVPGMTQTSPDAERYALTYFHILIWGAPAVLALYCFTGWFIGRQDAKSPMYIAVAQNVLNILASLFFVFALGWKVEGVAAGTLLAQWSGVAMAYAMARRRHGFRSGRLWHKKESQPLPPESLPAVRLGSFFRNNVYLFLRTLCLVAVMTYFTAAGAGSGETILAVNALLMQIFLFFSYFMDGFAYAGEALSGKLLGARQVERLGALVRALFGWGWGLAAAFTVLYWLCGDLLVALLTDESAVRLAAEAFLPYAVAIPCISFAAFLYDGLFVGITQPRGMLLSIAIATFAFFAIQILGTPSLGNHALWLAFLAYLLLRGVCQWALWGGAVRSALSNG